MRLRLELTLLASLAMATLAAQDAPSPARAPQQPTFRGGANLVRVDLYATRDGRLVEDLTAGEVEVFEDGVRQRIENFEHVKVAPPVVQELRAEPASVEASRQMAADPRARIFVIFLDTYHTQIEGSAKMREPLIRFIDRVVGRDDLVAMMTPEMSARDVTLGRKTTVMSNLLQESWAWGRRGRTLDNDPIEDQYEACYSGAEAPIATEMKARRREKLTLDALDDLIVHLGGLREERKAVIAVTEGWVAYGDSRTLAGPTRNAGRLPEPPDLVTRGVSRAGERSSVPGGGREKCEADRMALATMDHTNRLRRTIDAANGANVSFYPVYARGLAVLDAPVGFDRPPSFEQDAANLSARQNNLRLLAENTDGLAVVNTNNIDLALRRIVDDESSYYLLGYYSSNTKLDGGFRTITVRVARPGLQTRARRGYRAPTAAEMSRAPAAAPTVAAVPAPVMNALNAVAGFNARAEVRLRASAWAAPAGADGRTGVFWVVGSLDDGARRDPAWATGGSAEVSVRAGDGRAVLSSTVPLAALDGGFAVQVPERGSVAAGDYEVRVRVRPASGGSGGLGLTDAARVRIRDDAPAIGDAVVWRRRPSTGPQYFRTADPRAARADRLRLEFATAASGAATARLLDRTGNALPVPLQASLRDDASGAFRWIVVDAALAPLAPGDYVVEVTQGDATQLSGFRVVP